MCILWRLMGDIGPVYTLINFFHTTSLKYPEYVITCRTRIVELISNLSVCKRKIIIKTILLEYFFLIVWITPAFFDIS